MDTSGRHRLNRLRFAIVCVASCAALAAPARAARVTALATEYVAGQTFVRWTCPAGGHWLYHVYRASSPPASGEGIEHYTLIGTVGDSTWCDRRLSALHGGTYGYVLPDGTVLGPDDGLFVATCSDLAGAWYAVVCESDYAPPDPALVIGDNATGVATVEWVDRPQPVYQRPLVHAGYPCDVYTLWTWHQDTPLCPAMCNRPSIPYDCAIVAGEAAPQHALVFQPHVRGGNFLELSRGTGTPGEWVLTMDDHIETSDVNTFWFGYDANYDLTAWSHVPATAGPVVDFTMRRVIFTLEWARQTFPVDTTRTYVMGASMGGICGVFLAMRRPDLVAAAMVNVPLVDFSFESDPDAACGFGVGGSQRETCDHLFGPVDTHLLMPDSTPVFDMLNANKWVEWQSHRFIPPLMMFSGRYDTTIGWAEKPIFYETMRTRRMGGTFFFDNRTHSGTMTAGWAPAMDWTWLYRFRSDRSFPALSNCSADSDPGDGHAASGDSVGTINGLVEWDTTIVDHPRVWSARLWIRELQTQSGTFPAPESLWVDVTPRRLQNFALGPAQLAEYSVTRTSDATIVDSGTVLSNADGNVTVPAVRVYTGGSTLTIWNMGGTASVERSPRTSIELSGLPNPLRGGADFEIAWPRGGPAEIELFDLAGRIVRRSRSAVAGPGRARAHLDAAGLAAGVYVLRVRQGAERLTRRLVVVR